MKKHYRGKRHTYARASVSVGRDKKRKAKFTRQWLLMKRNLPHLYHFCKSFGEAMMGLSKSITNAIGTLGEIIEVSKNDT